MSVAVVSGCATPDAKPDASREDWLLQTNLLERSAGPAACAERPRVLILGDSISLGYTPLVKEKLVGVADVSRPACNCGPSEFYLKNMRDWVGTNRWNVIHVNFGIWDNHYLKGPSDGMGLFWGKEITNALPPIAKGTAIRDLGFRIRTPIDDYEKNLRTVLGFLNTRADRVVFGLTTPLKGWEKDDRCGRIRVYNEVAEKVCRELNVGVTDLYAVAERNLDKQTDGCHFSTAGYDKLADAVVASVRQALERTPARKLRLMTFNVRMGAGAEGPFEVPAGTLGHLPQCAEVIRRVAPDVVCIQEIDRKTDRAAGLDEPEELARLTGLHATFAPKLKLSGGEYGLAILSKEKPLSVETVYMPGSAHTRCLMICEFRDCFVANTHFPLKDELCENAAKIVRACLAGKSKPVYFMGDLNSKPTSATIRALGESFKTLSDVSAFTFPAKQPDRTIDYVMVDAAHAPDCAASAPVVVAAPEATDHCAIWLDVSVR